MRVSPPKPIKPFLYLWQKMTPEQRRRFSLVLKMSPGSARQYAEGRRGISSAMAIRIEKASHMMGRGFEKLSRMQLNDTCRTCEYAKRCNPPKEK